jgi:hypothetical protein
MDLLKVGDTVLYAEDPSQAPGVVKEVIPPDPELTRYVVEWPEGEPKVDEFHRAQLERTE